MRRRCEWGEGHALSVVYHDEEWGVPVHDDRRLFEFLILEGAQAGLSWSTILNKRDNYRAAMENFDPGKVARFSHSKIERLMSDPGIVRNRLKIESTVTNGIRFLEVQSDYGSFDAYLWGFVDGSPVQNRWRRSDDIPTYTDIAQRLSRDLKRRGFKFVGPTICYAYMQAVGLVNDHLVDCFRYRQVAKLR